MAVVDVGSLAAHQVPAGGAGVVLGRDPDGYPSVVRLFRPEPTRVALVAGWWAARLLAFRAMAIGALVAVHSQAPQQWQGLGDWAVGRPDRMALIPGAQPVAGPPGTAIQPVLWMVDGAARPPAPGPWQTQVLVVHQLAAQLGRELAEADVCILQRLSEPEAAVATTWLRLDNNTRQLVQAMPEDVFAVLSSGTVRFTRSAPTSLEQRYLGQPRRHG
ncbi:MAG TPA: hypothetical protein VFX61_01200 [Micromonosporaceae bacterium]|nr:hypothetical protein [Micromonosporaceae bacterium]